MVEYVQRKRGVEVERTKKKIKHGDKYGEVYLLETTAYLVEDVDAGTKVITKAPILPNGGLVR